MQGYVKWMSDDGQIWLIEAETNPEKVMDALLDQLNDAKTEGEKYAVSSLIKQYELTPNMAFIKKNPKKILYNPELHGE